MWNGVDNGLLNKPALISWKSVCLKKEHGGMGVLDLEQMNVALLCKLGWLFFRNDYQSIWENILKFKYTSNNSGRLFFLERSC